MRKIKLTQGKYTLIDNEDFDKVSLTNWRYAMPQGYAVNGSNVYLHRLLMNTPKGLLTDHINGDRLDNRKHNLRIVNKTQNNTNSRKLKAKTSIFKGVRKSTQRNHWTAQITIKHKTIHLGCFKEERHAAMAYDLWAKDIHKEFASTNF